MPRSLVPILMFWFAIGITLPGSVAGQEWMLGVTHQQEMVVGKPLIWDSHSFMLLARDGRLLELDAELIEQGTTIKQPFSSYSPGEMRAQLMREFGAGFEVQGTGHYLVVHPAGQRDWADRFENLYREMMHYFGVRGIAVRSPDFPLVAVVFPTQHHFRQYAARHGGSSGGNVLGYYSPETNRIYLYDVTAGGRMGGDWRVNAETIVHEASHQTAFNVGIHSRYALPPRWIAEGLGTLFEAPGVYSSATHPMKADRINHEQLAIFRRAFPQGIPEGALAMIVASDEAFARNTDAGYALSWAFTFMVAEQSPSQLSRYLQVTSRKRAFSNPSSGERIRDFQSVFGDDFTMTQARLDRFVAEL